MSEKVFRVLVLGYGEMGHAMEHLLADKHKLSFWDCQAVGGLKPVDFGKAARQSDFILFCIPASPHREMAVRLAPLLSPGCICLSIAKGLDERGYPAARTFSEVFGQRQPYGLLYGPMISEEIRAGRYGFAQLACSESRSLQEVFRLFAHTRLYIHHSTDVTGISWAVILKNVYAMSFGIADELELGDNMRGFLAVQAVRELDAIVQHMGGKAGTPYHLAGLGDLITTATSAGSHHHELGRRLARGQTENMSGEGIHTLEMVDKYRLFDDSAYPLYRLIRDIVKQPQGLPEKIHAYLESEFTPK